MKHLYFLTFILTILFTGCDKKETDTPAPVNGNKPANIEELLVGNWKEVETTVSEYDKNNTLVDTIPNISPIKVAFDGKKVITI